MRSGSFFTIGTTHRVCEDYAISGENFVILSDGCSSASHTDWGSRLLCNSARYHLDYLKYGSMAFGLSLFSRAASQCQSLNITPDCLKATLLAAVKRGNKTEIVCFGDGIFGFKNKKGWTIHEISFSTKESPHDAPFYFAYEVNETFKKQFFDQFGSKVIMKVYNGEELDDLEMGEIEIDLKEQPPYFSILIEDDCDLVFISSDGLSSFYQQGDTGANEKIESLDVLKPMLSLPDRDPGVVERRCNWMFRKTAKGTFPKLGWKNGDDVSLGVLYHE